MDRFAKLSDIKSTKTTIVLSSTDPLSVRWNDEVPGEGISYLQKHGKHIPVVKAGYMQDGFITIYEPQISYSITDGEIDILHISDLLEGTIILTLI